jgi:hypothetical protein
MTDPVPNRRRATRLLVGLHLAAAVAVTVQQVVGGAQVNNFTIFRRSFVHLAAGLDLYAAYPGETIDFFKYSPTSALLFAPFAVVPAWLGVLAWNLANAGALCWGIVRLVPGPAAAGALAICFFEAFGAIQNTQSNGLVAGLMILAVVALERGRIAWGAAAVMTGAAIKLFPLAMGVFGLVPRTRWRHVAWCAAIGAALLAAPLLVTSPDVLGMQYRSWAAIEARDAAKVEMWWIGGLLELWSGRALPHLPLQLAGAAWLCATAWLARARWDQRAVRQLLVASALGFAIVFNHMAEPPTFVIGFAGVGIWWAALPRARWRDALVLAVLLLGSVANTDAVPKAVRQAWVVETRLKAVAMLAAWVALQVDLIALLRRPPRAPEEAAAAAVQAAAA